LFSRYVGGTPALGLLILRVVFGAGLMLHGWPKIQAPFAWMGAHGSVPSYLQALSSVAEFLGGLALILGLITPLAALLVLINMIAAWRLAFPHAPWISLTGGKSFELPSLYAVVALVLLFTGPGLYSLDGLIFGRGKRS
jgi:putative oxidoreductase